MCTYCLKNPCPPGCPNYRLPKTRLYCDICGEGIFNGEEFVENQDGEYRHYDCFQSMRDLLEWLGYEIKTMEDIDEKY